MTSDEAIERVIEAVDQCVLEWTSGTRADQHLAKQAFRTALKELLAAHDAEALGMRDCFDPNCGKPGRHIGDCDKE